MATDRSNVKAGFFVLAGLAVGFVVIILLSDLESMFTPMQQVRVRYRLSDGLQGLREGANVTIGNYPIGTVTKIEQSDADPDDQDMGPVTHQVVTFEIPQRYALYDNARIELVTPFIGGGASLNIADVGSDAGEQATDPQTGATRRGESWVYAYGQGPIPGNLARSPAVAQAIDDLGIGDKQRLQIQNIISHVESVSADLDALTAQATADPNQVRRILARVESVVVKADDTLGRARDVLDPNGPMRRALETARAMLSETRPKISSTLDAADRILNDNEQTIGEALRSARSALADANDMAAQLKTVVTTQRPVLEKMIANMRLTSDQLKLAAIEVRRAPWRLLYKPTNQELETENLYDAARSFALAAGTLDATADSLNALVQRQGDHIDADDENLKLMLDKLHQSFEQFTDAEQQFWQALQEQRNK